MKSIVEEASSIFKAIENAWNRAGKPQDFSVKIFEEPQKNFFGLTTKSAKIGLFFKQKAVERVERAEQPRGKVEQRKPHKKAKRKEPIESTSQTAVQERKTIKPHESQKSTSSQSTESAWNQEMINVATAWVRNNLAIIGLTDIPVNVSASKYHLHIQFKNKLLPDRLKEKAMFSSFAYLIMATLRNKFKKEFRGLKVVLSTP